MRTGDRLIDSAYQANFCSWCHSSSFLEVEKASKRIHIILARPYSKKASVIRERKKRNIYNVLRENGTREGIDLRKEKWESQSIQESLLQGKLVPSAKPVLAHISSLAHALACRCWWSDVATWINVCSKDLLTWKLGTPERWSTSPTRGKEILAFTCNPGDAGWGLKCNHLVAKHAHKQRTIVCSDEAAFHFNVVVAGKSLVWFRWLAWISDSTLKLSPALSISSAFWRFWRWNRRNNSPRSSDLLTPIRRVTPLRIFHMEKTQPPPPSPRSGLPGQADRVTRLGGVPHLTWERDLEKRRDCVDRLVTSPRRGNSPAWGPSLPCEQALRMRSNERHESP